jgi:thiazole synthase ThiGH ThiG subunit
MAEFMSTPSQPNSIALVASLAQPMPASTSTGTLACCLMSLIEKTLYPNIVETLSAAQTLVNDGFNVMVYTSDDPIVAKELENIECVSA